ncbi:MAG: endonuclease/exonuclease/phosphatase family protein [Flavobacteriales bacterium]
MPRSLRPTFIAVCALLWTAAFAQPKDTRYVPMCVGFYNVENLYDTLDNPLTDDAEWLPTSAKQWNTARYRRKLGKMAQVISELGKDVSPDGVACMGFAELENRNVLSDLIHTPPLDKRGYQLVHHDSPDRRGVDVGFIYNPKHFTPINEKAYRLSDPNDSTFRTRDQLVVSGVLDGDTVSFIVAHWPSRRGGEKASMPRRILAAQLGRHIEDSLMARYRNARTLYMGDLNDDPTDPSVRKFLGAVGDKAEATGNKLFDPMVDLYKRGIGSLAWGDAWNLFDQIDHLPRARHRGRRPL